MKKFKNYIANLNITSKIWLCMVSIALTLSLFIGLFSSWYFLKLYREDTYSQTADSMQIGSQALTDAYNNLLANVIVFASSSTFSKIVNDAHIQNTADYIQNRVLLQESLSNLVFSNPLLDSVAVIGMNGEFYSLFSDSLKKDAIPASLFDLEKANIHGISWFPSTQSPYIKYNDIIPVIVPIKIMQNSRYLNIADSYDESDIFIVLMLDTKNVAGRLTLANSSYARRTLYIVDSSGRNINLPSDSEFSSVILQDDIRQLIASNRQENELSLLKDSSEYSIYAQSLPFCNLTLVEILPKIALHHRMFSMNAFIALIVLLGLGMAALLSFLLSRFVTRPFHQLIQNVHDMEHNTYDTPRQMKYQDEIGRLNAAINSMYATIQLQFEHMKESERAKYRSEIQLLSEQINPHFLYNTLECINMEVMGDHKEAAESMIRNLGDFLRIGLSYGNEIIPLSKELTHVKAYIDIMNYRFCKKIELKCFVHPDLEHLSVLKLILQPLAENSIRHGFNPNHIFEDMVLTPEIHISVYKEGLSMVLNVSDNGCGIDVERAEKALYLKALPDDKKNHVGLNNVWQRLTAYYGEVDISFETIPYYKNTVKILIPLSNPLVNNT